MFFIFFEQAFNLWVIDTNKNRSCWAEKYFTRNLKEKRILVFLVIKPTAMKSFLSSCFLLFSFLIIQFASAQCTIDFSYTSPGLYPDTLPTGYVGQSYSEDITFVMPLDTQGYDFTNFHILSISLPIGLTWQSNASANNNNYDPQVNPYGCVNVTGTPLLPGQYNVDVTVIADLTIVQGVPVTFQVYMEILPNTTSVTNTGFSMQGSSGCLPITVNFTNNNPGLLAYEWDFGNGNTSTNENPAPQVYNSVGDFVVNYQAWTDLTTVNVYTLTDVTINSISNSFDWGYPTELNPDPYFKILEDGNVIYNSSYVGDTYPPLSWTTSIVMDPTKVYVIEVWDEDDYELFYGGDDFIGSHTMSFNGCSGCAAGSNSVVSYLIDHVVIPPTPSVISADTVHVYGYPNEPNIVYDSLQHVLSTDSISTPLQWYFNESPIAGANAATDTVLVSGEYFVVAISSEGCVAFSDTVTAVYCQNITPLINQNGNVLSTPDTTGNTFQWSDDLGPISGANNSFYGVTAAGNYSVTVTDEYGCIYTSSSMFVALGLDDFGWQNTIEIYPNPANENVNISWNENKFIMKIRLLDITGKVILSAQPNQNTINFDLSGLSNGIYLIDFESEKSSIQRKLIIANN